MHLWISIYRYIYLFINIYRNPADSYCYFLCHLNSDYKDLHLKNIYQTSDSHFLWYNTELEQQGNIGIKGVIKLNPGKHR